MSGHSSPNIPLPTGTPPPPVFGGNHTSTAPAFGTNYISTPPVFGASQHPITFSDLARKGQDVMSSTLQQYGPAMPSMGHHAMPQNVMPQNVMMQKVMPYNNIPHNVQPHPGMPQNVIPQSVMHHGVMPQNRIPTSNMTQISMPQISMPQSNMAQSSMPQSSIPRSCMPQNSIPQSSMPQSSIPRSVIPQSSMPQTSMPQSSVNQTTLSHSSLTQTSTPQSDTFQTNIPPSVTSQDSVVPQDALPSSSTPVIEELLPEKQEIMKVVRERCEKYSLNELIQEYRDIENDMSEAQRNRAATERNLNEFMRQARGQNVEHEPKFIRLKKEKNIHAEECKEFAEALRYVSDKLDKRFDYKISQSSRSGQPLAAKRQPRSTARMGTTQPLPRPPKKQNSAPGESDQNEKRIMLDIKDSNLWCRECDVHYPTLKEYCDHLHKREHMVRCNRPAHPPWRTRLDQLSRKSSFDSYKSICHKLSEKLRYQFGVQDLDQALNPALKLDNQKLKQLMLKRERGDFAPDDPLFTYKGYELLIPINGYYCKICDRTLCDFTEVDQHLKSFEHNSEHAKSVALNPTHEKIFRQNLEKSYKEQHGVDLKKGSKEHSPNKHKETEKSKSTSKPSEASTLLPSDKINDKSYNISVKSSDTPSIFSANLPFRQPYKKQTSKIVDEHDVIADKFDKKDADKEARASGRKSDGNDKEKSNDAAPPRTSSTAASDISSVLKKVREDREIVPLNKDKPAAALKRLKHHGSKQASCTEKSDNSEKHRVDKEQKQAPLPEQQPQPRPNEHADDNLPIDTNPVARLSTSSDTDDSFSIAEIQAKRRSKLKKTARRVLESDNDDDVEIIRELHLEKGHKDSPFPELELSISGNVHYDVLKDPRLAAPLKVKLNRININDYKDILFDESDLWSRVNQMMTKKEPEQYKKDLSTTTTAAASYFKPNGDAVPIEVDFGVSSSDDEKPPFEMGMLKNFFCDQ